MNTPSEHPSDGQSLRGRKFPYRARNKAEQDQVNIELSTILSGVENMIIMVARRQLGVFPEHVVFDAIQECRVWLWEKSLPKWNAWIRPPVKISTYLHTCITNFVIQKKRHLKTRANVSSHFVLNNGMYLPAPDVTLDRKIEALAADIIAHPELYLTRTQVKNFKMLVGNPEIKMKDMIGALGHTTPSSLSAMKRRIIERISCIDIEDVQLDGTKVRKRRRPHEEEAG